MKRVNSEVHHFNQSILEKKMFDTYVLISLNIFFKLSPNYWILRNFVLAKWLQKLYEKFPPGYVSMWYANNQFLFLFLPNAHKKASGFQMQSRGGPQALSTEHKQNTLE